MNWQDANVVIKTMPMQLSFLLIGTLIFLMTACNAGNIPKGELDLSYHMTTIVETSAQTDLATAEEYIIDNEYVKADSNYENVQYIDEIYGLEIYVLPVNDECSVMNLYYNTWQEAYIDLLRNYTKLPLNPDFIEIGWYFALHDIDNNGTPEIFLAMLHDNGHVRYRSIYTFIDGHILPFILENVAIQGNLFFMVDDIPFFFFDTDVGFGVVYERLRLDGTQVVSDYTGYIRPSQLALDIYWETFNIRSGDSRLIYFYLSSYPQTGWHPEDNSVTIYEFEGIFGNIGQRIPIPLHQITEYAIVWEFE